MRDVEDRSRVERFVRFLVAILGGTKLAGVSDAQMGELSRLCKMLERADDPANFAAERANARRLIGAALTRLEMSESGLRDVHGALDAGHDAARPTLATLRFTKKVTTRRSWFEDMASAVAAPMGVAVAANCAKGCLGKTGHNGVSPCGTLEPALLRQW